MTMPLSLFLFGLYLLIGVIVLIVSLNTELDEWPIGVRAFLMDVLVVVLLWPAVVFSWRGAK